MPSVALLRGIPEALGLQPSLSRASVAQKWARCRDQGRLVVRAAASSPDREAARALVVGGGPAGALAAAYLGSQGWSVDVLERRAPPTPSGQNFSHNITLNPRGIMSLKGAGITPETSPEWGDEEMIVQVEGFCTLDKEDEVVAQPGFGDLVLHMANWYALVQVIARHCARSLTQQVSFHYGASITSIDLQGRRVEVEVEGASATLEYDLLVGADGVNSQVRKAMETQIGPAGGFTVDQITNERAEFKTFLLPRRGDGTERSTFFHSSDLYPELFAGPNPDGTKTARLVLHTDADTSFDALEAKEGGMEAFLRAHLAPLFRPEEGSLEAAAARMREQPARKESVTTYCSRLHGPGVVLLGDAGHSMAPNMGMGANTAMEDSRRLSELLGEEPAMAAPGGAEFAEQLEARLARFTEERLPPLRTICTLSKTPFNTVSGKMDLVFYIARMALNQKSPRLFPEPASTHLMDPSVPLGAAVRGLERERLWNRAIQFALGGGLAMAALVLVRVAIRVAAAVGRAAAAAVQWA